MQLLRLIVLVSIFSSGVADAEPESRLRDGGAAHGVRLAGADDAASSVKVYIVQLATPSAAEFHARSQTGFSGKPALGTSTTAGRFDKSSARVQSHLSKLATEQANVLSKLGGNVQPFYNYRYALNGFAATLSAAQANKLEHMSEVLHVWQDEIRPLTTSSSASFLGLFDADVGLRGEPGLDGEGIVIGVIDSGIAPDHPALKDTREADRPQTCRSTWGEGTLLGRWLCRRFSQMEDVQIFEAPENWNGTCETGPEFTEQSCNNKMIGARTFVEGALASGPIDSGEIFSARDVDGHGTHIATTAAGNRVNASIFGTFLNSVEGIAPKARIATYKACWLRPGTTRASCNTSDLANAIDMAVSDGVDLINYSVGNSMFTVTSPDDIALLAAAKAGVLASVAGGNEGPNFQTIGSPSGNPAVITVGASTRTGEHSVEAIMIDAPASIAGKYASKEASFTPPLIDSDPIEGQLILVDDGDESLPDGGTGNLIDACQTITNTDEISGNIAFIERGGCDFDVKIENADAAGATAVIVFNISGAPIVMVGDSGSIDIPAVMIGAADGDLLLGELDADEVIDVVIDKSFFLSIAESGNIMASFSSRGPGPNQDILKPDVTAPGVNILAGSTPDAANTVAGEFFAFLSGTSMSAPHVTGVAALLKQAHPDWSPAAIKSALMTTARQDITLPDDSAAIPFDFGSGHIVPNDANDPGLVYDISDDEYDAYSCGIASPGVSQARCDELATAGMSFDSVDLNQPSISVSRLTSGTTISRTVTNVTDTSETYTAEIELPPGIDVQVSPASLTVGAGQTATFDVTLNFVSGPPDIYRFGSLTWVSDDHRVRSVIAAQPLSIDAPREIFSFGGTGSETFSIDFGYAGSYTPRVHGLNAPFIQKDFVAQDPDKTFSVFDLAGVNVRVIDTIPDDAFIRFALFDELTDGDDDLDLYVYFCPVNLELDCYRVGESGSETSREQVDIFNPDLGTYRVYVHGFETDPVAGGPGTNYTLLTWVFGFNDDPGNMSVTGPAFADPGATSDITVNWNGLSPDNIYLGGISHNTPDGLVSLTLINIAN
ncbi:MAG: S8 family serine peptidase [Woeseiaceae bacterium]